jgi:hypothetical protein
MVVSTLHHNENARPASFPPPESIEDLRALELALQLRPRPLPWRPPDDDSYAAAGR